jgi:branched-chain amino acid aminotransferase
MHFYLAEQQARQVDPEASALLLDLSGNVTDTATANFLMVEGGTIISPTTRNILPGVSRAVVIALAQRLGISFTERDFPVSKATAADEAFISSTPYCLMPVTRINGLAIGDGRPGHIFRRVIEAWSKEVGLDIRKQIIEGAARNISGGQLP